MISLKERLDSLLVKLGHYESREKAKASIMAGLVYVDDKICDKAGTQVKATSKINIKQDLCPFVGRGGLKLKKAIEEFGVDLNNSVAMDVGASTGGFTDCMLQLGASKVYAVDVGYGQLHYRLRNDPRIVNMEKTNIRYLEKGSIEDELDFVSIDVSFISLGLVLPVVSSLLKEGACTVALVKPQFEAGKDQVGKGGIVKDRLVHAEVIKRVVSYGETNGLAAEKLTWSPIKGAKGNIEYLMLLKKHAGTTLKNDEIEATVESAIAAFK